MTLQQIKNIIQKTKKYQYNTNVKHRLISNIFEIFNRVNYNRKDKQDYVSMINLILKCCIDFDHTHKVFDNVFFTNIESILHESTLSHSLLIKCCIKGNKYEKGKELISKLELSNMNDPYIKTVLMDFYGHFGEIINSKLIFDSIPENIKDAVCIGSMMKIFIDNNYVDQALNLYDKYNNITNEVCDLLAIKACMKINDIERGKNIHQTIEKNKKYQSISLKSTLIDFYGTFGDVKNAKNVFDSINDNDKDIWCIGAMMESYYNNKYYQQCFQLFDNIHSFKLKPNLACYSIIFKNCTKTTSYYIGHKMHQQLKNDQYNKWILNDIQIQTKLINFYGKCGKTDECQKIFDDIKENQFEKYENDISIWNAIINAYGRNGNIEKIKYLYSIINKKQIDRKFYILLINACSHCNDVEFAKEIWENDIKNDNIKYDSFVITSIIDCFSRKGLIKQAKDIIVKYKKFKKSNNTSDTNDKIMWMSLLSAAKNRGDINLANELYKDIITTT